MPGSLGALPQGLSFLREDPLLAAAAVAVVLLAVLAGAAVVRWLRRTPGERFVGTLAKPDAVTVLMHPNPDPDAMACALGVADLARRAGTPATLQHPGRIRHQENRAFRTILDLECEMIETTGDLADGEVVLVDHNEARGFTGSEAVSPYAVVDHHPGGGTGDAFTDVREEYGACASIIAEYLRETGIDPGADGDDENALSTDVATGLLYGILSDTDHLTRGASGAEFDASAYLYAGIDEDDLGRIANPQVDAEVLDVKATAIRNREVDGPFAISDVGATSNADAIPQAADELLSLEGVSAVVVMGEVGDTIRISGRSRDDRVHMGNALAAAVEDIPMSSAGGHARMGGGQISVPHMEGLRPDSGIGRGQLKVRILDALAGNV